MILTYAPLTAEQLLEMNKADLMALSIPIWAQRVLIGILIVNIIALICWSCSNVYDCVKNNKMIAPEDVSFVTIINIFLICANVVGIVGILLL